MTITASSLDEMNLLLQFPTDSLMNGIKIHQGATEDTIAAAGRLFEKGFIDAKDGGYLTDAGIELVDHLKVLNSAMR